jgi:hypothetical protein
VDIATLESLGLEVDQGDGIVEAKLEIMHPVYNPLTRKLISTVYFTVMGDRLLFVGPSEFVGAQPINLALLKNGNLEAHVLETLDTHLYQLERRTTELSTLGVDGRVDRESLQLSAEFNRGKLKVVVAASRSGQFRVSRAVHEGSELSTASGNVFELSEFRSKEALEEFLFAMYSDMKSSGSSAAQLSPLTETNIAFAELALAFGDAQLPARTALEVVVDVTVKKERYRFAAARVAGREFRGLLAGQRGKVWAGRFHLTEFLGVKSLVARELSVSESDVEIVAS